MAHVGKLYPYLPRRDVSKYVPTAQSLLPLGMYVHLEGAVDLTWTWANGTNWYSNIGVVNTIGRYCLYFIDMGFHAGNRAYIELYWRLTDDGNVGRWQWWLHYGNLNPYCTDTGTNSSVSLGNECHWVNPSIPQSAGVNRGFSNASYARPLTWAEAISAYGDPLPLNLPG